MKYLKYKDNILRLQLHKNMLRKFFLSTFLYREKASFKTKFKIMLRLQSSIKQFQSMVKNRCIHSNFARGISRLTSASKAVFKQLYVDKCLTGFQKASW